MTRSTSLVKTSAPTRLINRVCRHWRNMFPVSFDNQNGEIALGLGHCSMRVNNVGLRVDLQAENAENLSRLEGVVAIHLQRMAGNEELCFNWERQP
ncbi:DUF2218 domain-containing protein [Pseudomonas sp. GCM10022188]|uniref:DUF2218 domain-containing protein n=1 Tax=Pseudomonas TaxID=286 RepID=UPI001E579517|nr:DUF2218 domain-containing protein [Pseudomonas oryzagri]MCC6076072.1 DUF2218 domain-containing protein [Pseudomonas oryzagri]